MTEEVLTDEEKVRRLYLVVSKLEEVKPAQFDFSTWVGDDWKGLPDLSCGTTACGLGLATTIPEFQELGLVMVKLPWVFANREAAATVALKEDIDRFSDPNELLAFHDLARRAGRQIFGINPREFNHIFVACHSLTLENDGHDPIDLPGLDEGSYVEDENGEEVFVATTAQELAQHICRFIAARWPAVTIARIRGDYAGG